MEQRSLAGRWFLTVLLVGLAALAYFVNGLKLGQDLKGGTTLRFALDIETARKEGRLPGGSSNEAIVEQTLTVIRQRIDRFGVAEVNLAQLGEDKFEIALPAEYEVRTIQNLVEALGDLQFRIEVLPEYPAPRGEDAARVRQTVWAGADGRKEDGTVEADKYPSTSEGFAEFKKAEVENWKQARNTATPYKPLDARYKVVRRKGTAGQEVHDFAVLEEDPNATFRFDGQILSNIRPDVDPQKNVPVVTYEVKNEFQNVFGQWTGTNVGLPMAIVLNEEYDSAPVIQSRLSDRVQITLGGDLFTVGYKGLEQRAKELATVLQTGSLKVKPRLESTTVVGPTLAGESVRRGILSTAIALGLVLIYMLVYYFGAGLVANVALLLNLVLLLGSMAFLKATLTLPGIAGIVLTLGMAVDANILVFERIREEQARGRSVARAVAEGFDRAFTTIVDSNVTTFITAAFLIAFGTGSIKGFGVSLTLGLLASMFTAIFVTRTLFEEWIRRGKTTPIRMLGKGRPPSVRWVALRRAFIPASVALMAASFLLFASSPARTVYDIDFTGGIKLQASLDRAVSVDDAKRALDAGPKTLTIDRDVSAGEAKGTKEVVAGPYGDAEVVAVKRPGGGSGVEIRYPLREGEGALSERDQKEALKAYVKAVLGDRMIPDWVREFPKPYVVQGDDDPRKEFEGRLKLRVALEDPPGVLTADELRKQLTENRPHWTTIEGKRTRAAAGLVTRNVDVAPVAAEVAGSHAVKTFDVWIKSDNLQGQPVDMDPEALVTELKEFLGSTAFRDRLTETLKLPGVVEVGPAVPFPIDDLVGKGVAHKLRNDAILAILLSFVAIVGYVAFRFRSYSMGFAAVFCLVHDVLIALGAVCLVDHLGVVDARINLGLVAAFLTIVGFSVNDTVVTFDRIRELRGSAPTITARMIDDAVNQTFARTIRTTLTVLVTLIVLFAMNLGARSMLEGLSFTLLVGVIAGSYSTIGMAAPLLLFLPWFWARARRYRPRAWLLTWPTRPNRAWWLGGAAVAATAIAWIVTGDAGLGVFYGLVLVPFMATIGGYMLWVAVFAALAFVAWCVLLVPWSFRPDPEAAIEEQRRLGNLPAPTPAPAREAPRSTTYSSKADDDDEEE